MNRCKTALQLGALLHIKTISGYLEENAVKTSRVFNSWKLSIVNKYSYLWLFLIGHENKYVHTVHRVIYLFIKSNQILIVLAVFHID